jgi:hypothetical protein
MVLAACGSYGAPDEVVYGEAVYTQQKPGFDFRPLTTYFLDPTVNVVEDGTTNVDTMPDAIKNAIDANMVALGYTAIPDLATALATGDTGLKMSVLRGSGAVYYPGYWCDYWTYYGCYYSWYYAGSYAFGTVILEMADLAAARGQPANNPIPILWTSAVYGVATTPQYDIPRVVDGINRAFGQSPYLDSRSTP